MAKFRQIWSHCLWHSICLNQTNLHLTLSRKNFIDSNSVSKFSSYFTEVSVTVKKSSSFGGNRCDQIGWFLKVLDKNLYYKSSPNIRSTLSELFWKGSRLSKNCCGYFLGKFWGKLGYFFLNICSHWWFVTWLKIEHSLCLGTYSTATPT